MKNILSAPESMYRDYLERVSARQARTYQDYEDEFDSDERSHCIHGTSQLTDCDSMCLMCETYGNKLPPAELEAKDAADRAFSRIVEMACQLYKYQQNYSSRFCEDIHKAMKAEAYDLVLHTSTGCVIVDRFFE